MGRVFRVVVLVLDKTRLSAQKPFGNLARVFSILVQKMSSSEHHNTAAPIDKGATAASGAAAAADLKDTKTEAALLIRAATGGENLAGTEEGTRLERVWR